MSWLEPDIEPGERVVLRNNGDRFTGLRAGFLAVWVGAVALSDLPRLSAYQTASITVLIAVLLLVSAAAHSMWSWCVTDRRIVMEDESGDRSREIPFNAIEAAWLDGGRLAVEVGGKVVDVPISDHFCATGMLRALLGDRFRNPGLAVVARDKILSPGETVKLGVLPEFSAISWLSLLVLFGVWAVLLVDPRLGQMLEGSIMVPMFFVPISFVLMFPDLVAAWRRRGWWIEVTDRRLLLRRWHEPDRYDAIGLAEIVRVKFDPEEARLAFHVADRELFLLCTKWSARRILAALGRDPAELLAS